MQISTTDQNSYMHSSHKFPRGVLNILSLEMIHALVQMWKHVYLVEDPVLYIHEHVQLLNVPVCVKNMRLYKFYEYFTIYMNHLYIVEYPSL